MGCDGGVYETYDHAKAGIINQFTCHLVLQGFHRQRLSTDIHEILNNFKSREPSRARRPMALSIATGLSPQLEMGFETQVEQNDPNIFMPQSQYGVWCAMTIATVSIFP